MLRLLIRILPLGLLAWVVAFPLVPADAHRKGGYGRPPGGAPKIPGAPPKVPLQLPTTGPKIPQVPNRGGGPPGGQLDLDRLQDIIRDAADSAWWRDNVWHRVFGGLLRGDVTSCVEASTARSNEIAQSIRGAVASGELPLNGHTIRVGVRSGYQVGGASIHTYSIIEVRDPQGRPVRTIEVDNYVVPVADIDTDADTFGSANPVDWKDDSQQAESQHTIGAERQP